MKSNPIAPLILLTCFILYSNVYGKYHEVVQDSFPLIDTILIASEPDYPPLCIVDKNGNADGLSIEVFKAAAKAVGLHVNVKIGIWSKIKHDLAKGYLDALPLVGRTPEREEIFDFTMSYISLHGAIFIREGEKSIKSMEDLKAKEIIVMKGDNAEEFVRRETISKNIITTNTFEEAFKLLSEGKHDAIITQRILGLNLLDQLDIRNVIPLEIQLNKFRQDFCFAVQEGNDELLEKLNEGLSIIIANNTYNEIRDKWLGPESKAKINFWNILKIVTIILLPIISIMVVLWIILLRSEIKRQTTTLKKEIEERKKTLSALETSEETYRNLFHNAQVGLFRTRISDGKILESNEQLAEMFGYDTREEIIAEYKTEGNYVDEGTRVIMLEEIKNKGYIRNFEARFYKKDRSIFWGKYTGKLYPDKGWIEGVVEDITEHKKADEELKELKEDLEKTVAERTAELNEKIHKLDKSQKAMLFMVEDLNKITAELKQERKKLEITNKELEAFTYTVSHDLRAPLRAINGFTKFIAEDYYDKLDNEGKRYINTIINNTEIMDQLITDMLNLSRISRVEMNLTQIDMSAMAKSVFNQIATIEEKETFELIIEDIPKATGDPALIKQVWQNLISNALKYSSKSITKKIHIYSFNENKTLVYCIKDNGVGFDKKYTHKLFGLFQRLHKKSEYEGTGVGLAIIRRIINRHGGNVWAQGENNKGAKFCFTLSN